MSGWVRLHRSVWKSDDFRPASFSDREAFLWSVCEAAHKPTLRWFNGTQIGLERGEFVTSLRKLAEACGWSEKRARGFTERMTKSGNWTQRKAGMGAQSKHPHATVITIHNFEKYQSRAEVAEVAEGAAEGAIDGEQGTQRGRSEGAQYNNSKNGEKVEEGKKCVGAPAPHSANRPFAEMVAMWSEAAAVSAQRCREAGDPTKAWKPLNPQLTDKRRKALAPIYDAHGLDGWQEAIQRALDSDLLGGPDPPSWWHFGFISQLEKFVNLKEGFYDRKFSQGNSAKQSGWLDANAAIGGTFQSPGGYPERALAYEPDA